MRKKVDGYIVEWDSAKNRINYESHGIDFETAAYVFKDQNRIEIYDDKHSIDEDRYCTIGRVGDVLFVVYTERGDYLRLISARIATRREEEMYYGIS